jgi:hypothetical protein
MLFYEVGRVVFMLADQPHDATEHGGEHLAARATIRRCMWDGSASISTHSLSPGFDAELRFQYRQCTTSAVSLEPKP